MAKREAVVREAGFEAVDIAAVRGYLAQVDGYSLEVWRQLVDAEYTSRCEQVTEA